MAKAIRDPKTGRFMKATAVQAAEQIVVVVPEVKKMAAATRMPRFDSRAQYQTQYTPRKQTRKASTVRVVMY